LAPNSCSFDILEQEFISYQVFQLPEAVTTAEHIDVAWHLLGQIKDPATGYPKFANCHLPKKPTLALTFQVSIFGSSFRAC